MSIVPDGFEVTFTQPVDPATAADARSYNFTCWHYKYGRQYGSPEMEKQAVKIAGVKLSDDKTKVTLTVAGEIHARQWIYYLVADGVRNADGGEGLRNKEVYYTVNRLRK
jgi:hypothetical protein